MRLRKYYQAILGYLRGRAVRLKKKIYIMPSAKQRKGDIFQYFL